MCVRGVRGSLARRRGHSGLQVALNSTDVQLPAGNMDVNKCHRCRRVPEGRDPQGGLRKGQHGTVIVRVSSTRVLSAGSSLCPAHAVTDDDNTPPDTLLCLIP